MKPQTYEDWQTLGYQVKKGEKATGKNKAGVATFTRAQVDDLPEWRKNEEQK